MDADLPLHHDDLHDDLHDDQALDDLAHLEALEYLEHEHEGFGADEHDMPAGCTISCSDCRLQGTSACEDCVVTFLLGPEVTSAIGRHPSSAWSERPLRVVRASAQPGPEVRRATEVRLDAREAEVLRLFQDAGMAPGSRHVRRVG